MIRVRSNNRATKICKNAKGQALVESAFVIPFMVFLILGIIQLTLMQQAKLMTKYAAFCAARAGIVFNGDVDKMKRAAFIALIPTFGRADDISHIAQTAAQMAIINAVTSAFGLPMVDVEIKNGPEDSDFSNYGSHLGGKQIDFDDIRPGVRDKNILSVKVRYFYELKIPFVNFILVDIWIVHRILKDVQIFGINLGGLFVPSGYSVQAYWGFRAQQRSALMTTIGAALGSILQQDAALAVVQLAKLAHQYYIPIEETYTLRMQSNWIKQ